jgi:uncharacterized protein with HEPN domain
MHADARKLLWDALQAAERVARFTRGKTFDDYMADELLRSGVERQLAIVGEALAQLRRIDPATADAIPALPRVVGFRNVLVHAYASVDSRVVWGIVEADLEPLRLSLGALLAQP